MALVRISFTVIIIFYSLFRCSAQSGVSELLNNLHTVTNEAFIPDSSKKNLFILNTSKSCIGCFEQLCGRLHNAEFASYNFYIISITNFDLLNLRPMAANLQEEVSCASTVLYYFIDKSNISELYKSPSPQLILMNEKKIEYYNYSQTLKFIGEEK